MADPAADRGRRQRRQSAERRQEFIDQAVAFFAEEGFESSTRELARRLGVTQPLLYRYFPSKQDLIAAVYDEVYLGRWRDEWGDLLADRSRPLMDRLLEFYDTYTEAIFQRDWMRIFLFSGLKGEGIHGRYLRRVRGRIIEPIFREWRAETGRDGPPTEREIEAVWTMHGGIFYYGVRTMVYEVPVLHDRQFAIRVSLQAFLAQLEHLEDMAPAGAPAHTASAAASAGEHGADGA